MAWEEEEEKVKRLGEGERRRRKGKALAQLLRLICGLPFKFPR